MESPGPSPKAMDQEAEVQQQEYRQNLVGAFIYNSLCIPVALGALYPLVGMLLSPLMAAATMSFSSVTVVANANRLKRFRPQEV